MNWKLNKIKQDNIWITYRKDGQSIEWKGFGIGPLILTNEERNSICEKLLQIKETDLEQVATQALQPFEGAIDKSLILHSTTSDLGAFQGDFTKLKAGLQPKNYAGYVETRAPFLGKAGDLAVGRMAGWKISVTQAGVNQLEIPNLSHYYLSDALLLLAIKHLETPNPSIERIIKYLKQHPHAVVRLYVLDKSFQIFLTWLQRQTSLDKIFIDANSPEVATTWNTKNTLYPTVSTANQMDISEVSTPYEQLNKERQSTLFFYKLGLTPSGLPGYVIQRKGSSEAAFIQQTIEAAQLLQQRYGLEKGCLKACNSGDGARITPNIDLTDNKVLATLAVTAYTYGDDYVLESHVHYETTTVGKQSLKLTPSAHIRAGKLADGITLQFTNGTSWVGNFYVSEQLAPKLGITPAQYQTMRHIVSDFHKACQRRGGGLAIAGMDFAIGQIGGKFGTTTLLGLQDPNISFNGAEFLREFMQRTQLEKAWVIDSFYAATWVFVPLAMCTHDRLKEMLANEMLPNTHSTVVAVVPNYWAMIGVAALNYPLFIKHLENIQNIIRTKYSS